MDYSNYLPSVAYSERKYLRMKNEYGGAASRIVAVSRSHLRYAVRAVNSWHDLLTVHFK